MNIINVTFKDENGETLTMMTATAKIFQTGSRGFHGQGKLEIDGKRYQTQVQLVEIGSKSQS